MFKVLPLSHTSKKYLIILSFSYTLLVESQLYVLKRSNKEHLIYMIFVLNLKAMMTTKGLF